MEKGFVDIIDSSNISEKEKEISQKVFNNKRISEEDALYLYNNSQLPLLSVLSSFINERLNGNKVFYVKNFHIEPSNICRYKCKFCSYYKDKNTGYELTSEEIVNKTKDYVNADISEVHIVGSVHPDKDLDYYVGLINTVKSVLPNIHVKAFSAVELDYMFKKSKVSIEEGLRMLKQAGLDSIPGGGAEIFDERIRGKLCSEKTNSEDWLNIHKIAHKIGIASNSTILYGHIEDYSHRVDHMSRLRNLQDETNGFNAFIPLKFRNKGNEISDVPEVSAIEDLKNYAISRIFMDNIPHIKAYWPMIGKDITQMTLSYGVDDIDGTIDDSTTIYSSAGSEEQSPIMTEMEMKNLITSVNKISVKRDSLYNSI